MPAPSGHTAQIKVGDENFQLWGYKTNPIKTAITWILTIITIGAFRLFLYWYPNLLVKSTCSRCALAAANFVLVRDEHMNFTLRAVQLITSRGNQIGFPIGGLQMADVCKIRYFTNKKIMHIWHPSEMKFTTVEAIDSEIPLSRFHELVQAGLDQDEVQKRLLVYGKNLIDVKLKPILVLLFKEVITPFYIFQAFSVSIWFSDEYEIYASIIVAMSLISIGMDLYQTRKQEKNLRSMVHSSDIVQVIRNNGQIEQVDSEELVPGDVILIPSHGCTMQCDAVLMNGTVIVNESMLTGESVPVTKVALPEIEDDGSRCPMYSIDECSKHTIFCGTQVLQTRYYGGYSVKAVVFRTSYSTLKGQLVRSIMYPKPVDFRFTKDLFKFVGFLSSIAACGFAYTIAIMIIRNSSIKKIIIRALDIVTIVVPPALPAAMSIGIFAAQMRLRKKQIFCISPSTINTCGAINCVCFDKTGTLTEDGLDFHCLRPLKLSNDGPLFDGEFQTIISDEMTNYYDLLKAIATCHSLTRIQGQLCGDPLDLILFKNTGWVLDETVDSGIGETERFDVIQPTVVRSTPGHFGFNEQIELAVIRQFTFSSSLQRMTVIVHDPKEQSHNMRLYCKGSPEMVASLCKPETIPQNYSTLVNDYAQHGYRLIAVASKTLDLSFTKSQKVKREVVECDLTMLGLVAMENRLKPQTVGVINKLTKARVRTIMVTGDNVLTAMSVARECAIIQPNKRAFLVEIAPNNELRDDGRTKLILRQSVSSSEDVADDTSSTVDVESGHLVDSTYQLAVSGPTFSVICKEYPEFVDKLVSVCDVYARMSPDQKQLLVNRLQQIDYTVAFCGDGANDCAALKAAHAGISLSEAEASIAAPFTSKIADISCVPMVIREGRAALVTSFGVFKYMAGYSLTQFISILLLYWLASNLTDFQFLYIDLGLVTLVALFFGNTPACERLCAIAPPTKLLSLASILSVVGQLTIVAVFQLFIFIFTAYQPWFFPYAEPYGSEEEDKRSLQGTAVFCVSTYQYITLGIIYSKGFPYRKTLFSNIPLCASLGALAVISTWICIYPPTFALGFMEYELIPEINYRLFILIVGIISSICAYLYETYFIEYLILTVRENWRKKQELRSGSSQSNRFEQILLTVGNEPNWILTPKERYRIDNSDSLIHRQTAETILMPNGFTTPPSSPTTNGVMYSCTSSPNNGGDGQYYDARY